MMKSVDVQDKIVELSRQAQALEQANSGLRSRCKALTHILAHQDLMAALQRQINSQADAWQDGPSAAGTDACSMSLDSTMTQELLHEQWALNPLLQCFHSSRDPCVYTAVRDSSAKDIGQAWLLLLSTLSFALHVHDMQPQQAPSNDMLCKAVTDCNRFIAAVNLLKEDVWPELWHLNLLTGSQQVPSREHWQAAMAAAAPTAAQLQEARDVLAVTTSKLKATAEEVGRRLQEVAVMVNDSQQEQQEPQDGTAGQQQQWCRTCQHTAAQEHLEGSCGCRDAQLVTAVLSPACSSSGGPSGAGGCLPPPTSPTQLPLLLPAGITDVRSNPASSLAAQHSSCCTPCGSSGSFLQVLSSLESREEAMQDLSSRLSTWRVLRMMLGALTFLLRPDQLARLYLYSMPFMPIGCLLCDEIGIPDLQSSDAISSSC